VDGGNLYGYGRGNPIKLIDRTGTQPKDFILVPYKKGGRKHGTEIHQHHFLPETRAREFGRFPGYTKDLSAKAGELTLLGPATLNGSVNGSVDDKIRAYLDRYKRIPLEDQIEGVKKIWVKELGEEYKGLVDDWGDSSVRTMDGISKKASPKAVPPTVRRRSSDGSPRSHAHDSRPNKGFFTIKNIETGLKYLGPLGSYLTLDPFLDAETTEEKVQTGADLAFDAIGYTGIGTPASLAYDATSLADDALGISDYTSEKGFNTEKNLNDAGLPEIVSHVAGAVGSFPFIGNFTEIYTDKVKKATVLGDKIGDEIYERTHSNKYTFNPFKMKKTNDAWRAFKSIF